jgi:hypothetical protein
LLRLRGGFALFSAGDFESCHGLNAVAWGWRWIVFFLSFLKSLKSEGMLVFLPGSARIHVLVMSWCSYTQHGTHHHQHHHHYPEKLLG